MTDGVNGQSAISAISSTFDNVGTKTGRQTPHQTITGSANTPSASVNRPTKRRDRALTSASSNAADSDGGGSASGKKRLRLAVACDRCHRRKQKCDGGVQCGPCRQAGVQCTLTDKMSNKVLPRSHVPDLEARIQWLESLLDEVNPGMHMSNVPTGTSLAFSGPGGLSPMLGPRAVESPEPSRGRSTPTDFVRSPLRATASPAPSMFRGTANFPLPPAATPGAGPFGLHSSGRDAAARARSERMSDIRSAPPRKAVGMPEGLLPSGQLFLDPTLESNEPISTERTYGSYTRLPTQPDDILNRGAAASKVTAATIRAPGDRHEGPTVKPFYPRMDVALRLIDAYFCHTHTASPFLHHRSFMERFHEFYQFGPEAPRAQMVFILNMVLAIGETTLSRQATVIGREHQEADPRHRFFEVAMDHLELALDRTTLATVQCMLLLVVYGLHHPDTVSIYRTSGLAMRICVELSLHREQNNRSQLTLLDRELRKRIFWSCYSLDRFVSLVLGRPCAIVDENVSCELPADVNDDCILEDRIQTLPPGVITEMTYSLAIIKLRRLMGRILGTLYCTQHRPNENLAPAVDRFVTELEAWRLTIPSGQVKQPDNAIVPSIYRSSTFYELGYFHARLLLYRLLAPKGNPSDIRHCAEAALRSVKLYKQLLDEKTLTVNFAPLAMCFTAGVTMLWCVFLCPPQTPNPEDGAAHQGQFFCDVADNRPALTMLEVQEGIACTSRVLLALAKFWEVAQKCADLFKDLCEGVVVTSQNNVKVENGHTERSDALFNMTFGRSSGYPGTATPSIDTGTASTPSSLLMGPHVEGVQADVTDLFARVAGQLPETLRASYGGGQIDGVPHSQPQRDGLLQGNGIGPRGGVIAGAEIDPWVGAATATNTPLHRRTPAQTPLGGASPIIVPDGRLAKLMAQAASGIGQVAMPPTGPAAAGSMDAFEAIGWQIGGFGMTGDD
ncbi:hypothetical protein PYCC9005_002125 [Savitreella phatthalungensis]